MARHKLRSLQTNAADLTETYSYTHKTTQILHKPKANKSDKTTKDRLTDYKTGKQADRETDK